jgi:hypothetical protein
MIIHSQLPHIPSAPTNGAIGLDVALRRLPAWAPGRLERVQLSLDAAKRKEGGSFSELEDPLSPFLPGFVRTPPLTNRSASELGIAVKLANDISEASFSSGKKFTDTLIAIQRCSLPSLARLRDKALRSEADANGHQVEYPPPLALRGAVEGIAASVRPLVHLSPTFAAAAAMIAITSLHPFLDGNGRVSRVVFNGLLASTGTSGSYLPLFEIGLVSNGGWLLALRRAQRGDWERLMRYLTAAVDICIDIQQSAD